jgi:hypothetical protein
MAHFSQCQKVHRLLARVRELEVSKLNVDHYLPLVEKLRARQNRDPSDTTPDSHCQNSDAMMMMVDDGDNRNAAAHRSDSGPSRFRHFSEGPPPVANQLDLTIGPSVPFPTSRKHCIYCLVEVGAIVKYGQHCYICQSCRDFWKSRRLTLQQAIVIFQVDAIDLNDLSVHYWKYSTSKSVYRKVALKMFSELQDTSYAENQVTFACCKVLKVCIAKYGSFWALEQQNPHRRQCVAEWIGQNVVIGAATAHMND